MAERLHAPTLPKSISSFPCTNCGGVRPEDQALCDSCEDQEHEFLKALATTKPWDENSFGVLAEKVLCDGCAAEIDPRQSNNLCAKCIKEVINGKN